MDFAYIFVLIAFLPICRGQDAVQFQIKINPESEYQLFRIGEGRALTCTVSETPDGKKPDLSWEIGDVRVTDTDQNSRVTIEPTSSGLMLRIADVVDGDGGTYKCTGTLGGQEDSRSIRVEVFKPLKINSPQKQWGILDEDGTVSCDATGKPSPTITWKFSNYTNIANSDKYVISPNKLTIKQLEIDDAKRYICDIVVVHTGETRSFNIDYEVVQLPVIRLLPTIKPNNPKVGDKVEIRCEAEGRPKPTYSFFRGENLIPEDKVDEENGILTLLDVKREDEATYMCKATNIGGEDSKSNTLDVLIPPVIENIADINAVEGGEIRLTCIAEGDPQPSVTWKKDGAQQSYVDTGKRENDPEIIPENFDNNINAEIKKAGRTILFKPVRPEDAGTYTCTSMNIVGNSSRNVKFEVKYKPNFNNNFQQKEFMGWPGHRANLTCMASANDLASITWYEPNSESPDDKSLARRIENKAPFTITSLVTWPEYHLSSSSLLVEITPNDNSLYKDYLCEAKNTFDSAWRTVTLKEAVVPGQPVVRQVSSFSSMVTLEFEKPENDGGVPVTGYKYTWYLSDQAANIKELEADITGDTTTVDLKGLQAGSNYVVKVQARNPVGLSSANSIQFTTAKVSKPLKLSIESPTEGTDDTTYTIQWADPDNGGSPILKYNIKYRLAEVTGTDAKSWKVIKYLENDYKVETVNGANARQYTITSLMRDSYYEIRITAVNDKGESDEEFKIIKTSKGEANDIEDDNKEEEENTRDNIKTIKPKDDGLKENNYNETSEEILGNSSDTVTSSGSAGIGAGATTGIVIGILIVFALLAIILYIKTKKPELVESLRGRLGGKGGEEERGKKEDGKDPAEEEKLIKKEDTVKVENETEDGKNDIIEKHAEEFEPDSKPEPQVAPQNPTAGAGEKTEELSTPAPTTEIKITPETPEKPENPTA